MNAPPPIPSPEQSETPSPEPAPVAQQEPPSVPELFMAFAKVSLAGFGGVLAWSRRMMVKNAIG